MQKERKIKTPAENLLDCLGDILPLVIDFAMEQERNMLEGKTAALEFIQERLADAVSSAEAIEL